MLEWKQNSYQRKRNQCPRCLKHLINGRCPRCAWPDFKLPAGKTTEEWERFEKEEIKRRERQKIKRAAQKAVKKAVREGTLTKPRLCERCGSWSIKDRKLEAHHWSYKKENWLDIIWLCIKCHRRVQDYSTAIMSQEIKQKLKGKLI